MALHGARDRSAAALPLSVLLSQVLVALTIEMDTTYETRAPHRTTALGGTGPWLISYAMWSTFLRLLPDEGIAAGDLSERSGQGRRPLSPKAGVIRWGYVSLEPSPVSATVRRGPSDLIVRPTRAARRASARWEEVLGDVEARWRDRFGSDLVDLLRADGEWAAGLAGRTLPAYLPVLGPRLLSGPPASEPAAGPPSLVTALANALHAFAIEAESGWSVGLAAVANPLRVLGDEPVRLADIPKRTGVSKEATAYACGVLARLGALDIGSDPTVGRGRIVRRTPRGGALQEQYVDRLARVEGGWIAAPGSRAESLRVGLEAVLDHDRGTTLRECLAAPEGTWRSRVRQPDQLPHFPFVWHRGGYPDGA